MVNEIVGNRFEQNKTESTLDDSFTTATLDHLEPETIGTGISKFSTLPKTNSLPPVHYGQPQNNFDQSQGRPLDVANHRFDQPDSGFMSSHHVENLKDGAKSNLRNGTRSRTQSIDHVTTPRPVRPPPPDTPISSDEYRFGFILDGGKYNTIEIGIELS